MKFSLVPLFLLPPDISTPPLPPHFTFHVLRFIVSCLFVHSKRPIPLFSSTIHIAQPTGYDATIDLIYHCVPGRVHTSLCVRTNAAIGLIHRIPSRYPTFSSPCFLNKKGFQGFLSSFSFQHYPHILSFLTCLDSLKLTLNATSSSKHRRLFPVCDLLQNGYPESFKMLRLSTLMANLHGFTQIPTFSCGILSWFQFSCSSRYHKPALTPWEML